MAEFGPAAFRQDPFTVEADGHYYTFPAVSAAVWLDSLASRAWTAAVLGMADNESYDAFVDRAERGEAGPGDMQRIAHLALAEAAGRSWWEAIRLAAACLGHPDVTGAVLMRGVDPSRCTLAAFLSVVWSLLSQGGNDAERMQRQMELTMPPPEALEEDQPAPMTMEEMVAQMRAAPGVSTR